MHGQTSHSVFRFPCLFSPVPCALFPAAHACLVKNPRSRPHDMVLLHPSWRRNFFLPFPPPHPFPSPSWQCSDVAQHLATHGSCRRPVPTPGSPTSLPHSPRRKESSQRLGAAPGPPLKNSTRIGCRSHTARTRTWRRGCCCQSREPGTTEKVAAAAAARATSGARGPEQGARRARRPP